MANTSATASISISIGLSSSASTSSRNQRPVSRRRSQSRGRSKSRTRSRSVRRAAAEEAFWNEANPLLDPFTLDLTKKGTELNLPSVSRLKLDATPPVAALFFAASAAPLTPPPEKQQSKEGDLIQSLADKFHADMSKVQIANHNISPTEGDFATYSQSELTALEYAIKLYFARILERFLLPAVKFVDLLALGKDFLHFPLYEGRFWSWITTGQAASHFSGAELRSYTVLIFRYLKCQKKASYLNNKKPHVNLLTLEVEDVNEPEEATANVSTTSAHDVDGDVYVSEDGGDDGHIFFADALYPCEEDESGPSPSAKVPLYTKIAPVNPFTLTPCAAHKLGYQLEGDLDDFVKTNLPSSEEKLFLDSDINKSEQQHLLRTLRLYLFFTRDTPEQVHAHFDERNQALLRRSLVVYFGMLSRRLSGPTSYLKVYSHHNDLPYWDYASAGARFWGWLVESAFFSEDQLRVFSLLLYRYLGLFPPPILELRRRLMKVVEELISRPIDARWVPSKALKYTPLEPWTFYESLLKIEKKQQQLVHFLQTTSDPPNMPDFISFLTDALKSVDSGGEKLGKLSPSLSRMTSLTSSGGHSIDAFGSITFFLELAGCSEVYLDDATSIMAYEALSQALKRVYRIKTTLLLSHEMTLDFTSAYLDDDEEEDEDEEGIEETEASQLKFIDATLTLKSAFWRHSQVYQWLSAVEPRFGQLTAALKYWAHANHLVSGSLLRTVHDFVSLVIFALQHTSPPVFESLEAMTKRMSSDQACSKKAFPENTDSTAQLAVSFFRFYATFDFARMVIRPWTAKACPLETYPNEATANSFLNIEDWYSLVAYQTCSPSSFARFRRAIIRVNEQIDAQNAFLILANPQLMEPQPPKSRSKVVVESCHLQVSVSSSLATQSSSRNEDEEDGDRDEWESATNESC